MTETRKKNKSEEKDLPILIAFAAVVAFFLASGYVTYSNILILKEDADLVIHTHEVLVGIDTLASLLKDAETGQRGFILTGKDEYLEPHNTAVRMLEEQLNNIQRLTQDNQEQQERIPTVKVLANAKLQELAETIELRKKEGFEKALAVVVTDRGKKTMDELRSKLDEMRKIEITLRVHNLKEIKNSYTTAIVTGIVSSFLGILLSVAITFFLRRVAKQRYREEWFQAGQVGLGAVMSGDLTVEQLGQNILKFLAEYLDAHVGVFFSKDDGSYRRKATYGFPADCKTMKSFENEDGLLGQAVKDARAFLVRDVPDGYLKVGSGLGQSNPRRIMISPVLADGAVNAVFELGFIHSLDDRAIELMDKVSKSIGIAVQSANYRENLQKLLEETQSQSEELQTQSEELRVSNEELEEKTQALEELNIAIKENGQRLSAVVDNAVDGIISIDERGLIQNFNPSCERIFGYKAAEVMGKNIKMLMPEPYHSGHDGYLSRYAATGDAHIIGTAGREVSGKRKDGSVFPMDLSVSAFQLEGKRYYSGTVRDITQRKEAENRILKYQEELELSSKYKSEFLANMSHELRTPLNSLLILAHSLASNEEGNLTPDQVEEANIIHNGGLELLNLINDILDLSKVEAGKMNIVIDNTSLASIVKRLEQQFMPIVSESGLVLDIRMDRDIPATIRTDSQRVEQILKNLLSNACKFTEAGSVTLHVFRPDEETRFQRSSLNQGNALALAVTDTGIGIEASKLNSIFEAFQQEDGSIDRHYGGTGLGLTIARKFAHMLGGEIHVVSKKGKGSTFTLILPLTLDQVNTAASSHQEKKEAMLPVTAAITPKEELAARTELKIMPKVSIKEFIADDRNTMEARDKTLLIIEGDREFAHVLMQTAHKWGYKCLVAGDGKTGILLAAEQSVNAIILDLSLPDTEGLSILDQLKHDLKTRHIPVHIIVDRDTTDMIVPLRKGAIGCLVKPIKTEDMENVFTKIEGVLQSAIKKILVVEDDKKNQAAILSLLKKKDVEITCAVTGHAGLQLMMEEKFDCIILDLLLPDMTGFVWLDALEEQAEGAEIPPVVIYTAKELTEEENRSLGRHTSSIVIKGAHSSERLLDEVTLFLHSVESSLSKDQQAIIRMQHNPDKMLQDRTVLLVDDDMRNTFALSKLLRKHGMNVVIADNGQMALQKLHQEENVELVIMDIMMPIMDGYQAIREIRGQKQWQRLPIIALTARAMPEEQEKCVEAGANDYMTKPVDIERLLTLIRVWMFRQDEMS